MAPSLACVLTYIENSYSFKECRNVFFALPKNIISNWNLSRGGRVMISYCTSWLLVATWSLFCLFLKLRQITHYKPISESHVVRVSFVQLMCVHMCPRKETYCREEGESLHHLPVNNEHRLPLTLSLSGFMKHTHVVVIHSMMPSFSSISPYSLADCFIYSLG